MSSARTTAVERSATEETLAGAGRHSAGRRATFRMAAIAATIVVVFAVGIFLFLAIGPRVLGYRTATMLTGSMSPLINTGDVVVSSPVPVRDLAADDIITYHIPIDGHRVETHRIVEVIANADGTTAVRTKGDANNDADPWTATLTGDTAYRHVFTVPYLGHVIRTLRDPAALPLLMYGAPALLVTGGLVAIWRKIPDADTDG
jgi:signal peptidase I